MGIDPHQLARIMALRTGHAVRKTSHRQLLIREDALIMAPIEMAGEDASLHAIAIGHIGQAPTVYSCPDPRNRDALFELLEALAREVIFPYWSWCVNVGRAPQMWVSSGGVAGKLETLNQRLRYTRNRDVVRKLGLCLTYFTERSHIAGQQALVTASEALCAHWATGQQPGEDQHLGAVLAWLDPAGHPVQEAVAASERRAMGTRTLPAFDRDVLDPLLRRFHNARKANDPTSMHDVAEEIHGALSGVACGIYGAIQTAIAHIQALDLPELGALDDLEPMENRAFAYYARKRAEGWGVSHRDSARQAAARLREREDAQSSLAAAALIDDPIALQGALMSGRAVRGRVQTVAPQGRISLVTEQPILRARHRDTFVLARDPRLQLVVESTRRVNGQTHLQLRVLSGQRAVGVPQGGAELLLVPSAPRWFWIGKSRSKLFQRTTQMPWTHLSGGIPSADSRAGAPADPLAALETLK